jgi:NAD-dependent dihydropyrimidine dehydrogenase PreA subunit
MEKVAGSKKRKATINADKCFGCGVCVLTCEPKALTLKLVRPPEHIPSINAYVMR